MSISPEYLAGFFDGEGCINISVSGKQRQVLNLRKKCTNLIERASQPDWRGPVPGIRKTMTEFEAGKLHSGSKSGPVVKSLAQARAIGLSEERKAGHTVKHHHEPTAPGHMAGVHDHHTEQGHKTHGGGKMVDGAGRKGHDMEIRSATEHKAPHHPEGSHTVQGHIPEGGGVAGHPGEIMRMDHDGGSLLGNHYSQQAHEPAVLKHENFTAGHSGMHAGLGTKPHGFGHAAHQRSGQLRNSGHPNAHRIGKR